MEEVCHAVNHVWGADPTKEIDIVVKGRRYSKGEHVLAILEVLQSIQELSVILRLVVKLCLDFVDELQGILDALAIVVGKQIL